MNAAVAWLESEFDRLTERRHKFGIVGPGPACHRAMIELAEDVDDGETLAAWPEPMVDDDLDIWDLENESGMWVDELASFVSAAETGTAHTFGALQ